MWIPVVLLVCSGLVVAISAARVYCTTNAGVIFASPFFGGRFSPHRFVVIDDGRGYDAGAQYWPHRSRVRLFMDELSFVSGCYFPKDMPNAKGKAYEEMARRATLQFQIEAAWSQSGNARQKAAS